MNRTTKLALAGVVGTAQVALAGAVVWALRRVDEAVTDLRVDASNANDDDDDTRQLDPDVLRWMREQPCGVELDVLTGVVTRVPNSPPGYVALDTTALNREYQEQQAATASDAPPPNALQTLLDEFLSSVLSASADDDDDDDGDDTGDETGDETESDGDVETDGTDDSDGGGEDDTDASIELSDGARE